MLHIIQYDTYYVSTIFIYDCLEAPVERVEDEHSKLLLKALQNIIEDDSFKIKSVATVDLKKNVTYVPYRTVMR